MTCYDRKSIIDQSKYQKVFPSVYKYHDTVMCGRRSSEINKKTKSTSCRLVDLLIFFKDSNSYLDFISIYHFILKKECAASVHRIK